MFTISVETRFWAAHQLALTECSKEPLHSHNWSVTADVSSEALDGMGLVMDFRHLVAMLDDIVAVFGNIPLERIDYFRQNGSSAETIARYVYESLESELPKGTRLEAVRVVEELGCSARFSRDKPGK